MFFSKMIFKIIAKFHSISALMIIDINTENIIAVNKKACNFYGYTMSQFEKLNVKDLSIDPKNYIKHISTNVASYHNHEHNFMICKHKLHNGEIKDIKINFSSILLKKYICCSIEDVTKYKTKFKETLNYTQLLDTVLKGIPDIIGVYKPDHTILFYNEAGYKFYNKTPLDMDGKKCYHMLGRDCICPVCPTEKAIKSKKVIELEKYIPELDKYMSCSSIPVLNDEGTVELVVEQLRDITQRKKDLNMAAKLQFNSLTKEFPLCEKAEMEISYTPCKTVSGDYFTLRKLDENTVIGILIDVSGKGISAALNISAVKILFEEVSRKKQEPRKVLDKLNKKLIKYMGDNFIAAMCFIIDFKNNKLTVSGAGLNELGIKRNFNDFQKIILKGSFLGMFEDSIFDQCTIDFNKGDTFYFYSDGLDWLFNEDNFKDKDLNNLSINQLKHYVDNYLDTQLHENLLKDDCTLISIKIK